MAWGEVKERFSIMLTPTAAETIDIRAKALKLSRSELLEQMARGMVGVSDTDLTKEDRNSLGKPSGNLLPFTRTS
jgi:metal-responsive CopG/Arc/MetJ family transcriptional regulator